MFINPVRPLLIAAIAAVIAIPALAASFVAGFQPTGSGIVPPGLAWQTDKDSGIHYAAWVEAKGLTLADGKAVAYGVAAVTGKGLDRIEIMVNGEFVKTCRFDGSLDVQGCRAELKADAYNVGTQVYVNANIVAKGVNAWTEHTIFTRQNPVATANATLTSEVSAPVSAAGPIFRIAASVTPNLNSVKRGETLAYTATAQNNTLGLHRTELYVNGKLRYTCRYGAVVSAVTCADTVGTSEFAEGTAVTLMALAVDNDGHERWSDARTVAIQTATTQAPATDGLSVWSWLMPNVTEIVDEQSVPYMAGAWSTDGVKRIEIIRDGATVKTCAFAKTDGNKECAYDLKANEYVHGRVIVVNARVTDWAGRVQWTEPRTVAVRRAWAGLPTSLPYIAIATNRPDGYAAGETIAFTFRSWSPIGVDRMELFINGVKSASCPNDVCVWTSGPQAEAAVEVQARLIDRAGHDTWSGLYGIRRK